MNTALRRNKHFALLLSGQIVSSAGDHIQDFAFLLLVLAMTGSAAQSGLVLGVNTAAYLLVGLLAGALVDRWDRRRTMIWCELGRAALAASIAVALWLDRLTLPHLYVVAALGGVLHALFQSANTAALPTIVGPGQIARALGVTQGALGTLRVCGATLAAAVYGLGRTVPFAVNAVSFVVSAIALRSIRTPFQTEPGPRGDLDPEAPRPHGHREAQAPHPRGDLDAETPHPQSHLDAQAPRPRGDLDAEAPRPRGHLDAVTPHPQSHLDAEASRPHGHLDAEAPDPRGHLGPHPGDHLGPRTRRCQGAKVPRPRGRFGARLPDWRGRLGMRMPGWRGRPDAGMPGSRGRLGMKAPGPRGHLGAEIREGLGWLWHQPVIRLFSLLQTGDMLRYGAGYLVIVTLAQGVGATPQQIGLIFSAAAAGALLGSLLAARLTTRFPIGRLAAAMLWVEALVFPLYAFAPNPLLLGLVAFTESVLPPAYSVAMTSHRLAITPDHLRGRTSAALETLTMGALSVGTMTSGAMIAAWGPKATTLVLAAWLLLLAITATTAPAVRRAR